MLDEFLILIMIYHLFYSTDMVYDAVTRYQVGWLMIINTSLILALRLSALLIETTRNLIHTFKLEYRRYKHDKRIKKA